MKSILAIIVACTATTTAAAAPVPAADQTAIRAFLNKLYGSYRNDRVRTETLTAHGSNSVFTPSTDRLRAENERLSNGENTGLDFDFFCSCNDYDKTLALVSAVLTPLPKGRVNARVTINNYGKKALSIQFERTSVGWRVYDVELPQLGMLRAVLIKENAELSKGAGASAAPAQARPSQPGFPENIEYAGYTGSERFPVFNDFKVTARGGSLGGSVFMQIGIFSGDAPITGTYANGECMLVRKKQTYRGSCDANEFSGIIYSASGKPGERFRFLSTTELARRQASGAQGQTSGAAPLPPTSEASYEAQAVAVPSYGRSRLLVEPDGRCSETGQLVKGYCFDRVIGYLRQRPDKNDVTVVTMTRWSRPSTWCNFGCGPGPHRSGGFGCNL